jgi:hypothetical protein
LLVDPFVLRWETWSSFVQALRELPRVRARRKELLARRQLLLGEVLHRISEQAKRLEVQAYCEDTAPVRPCPYAY